MKVKIVGLRHERALKSDEWTSYLPMPNYPEYPSATAAICYAHAEAMRRTLGTDHLKWTVDLGKGPFLYYVRVKGWVGCIAKYLLFLTGAGGWFWNIFM